MASGSGPVQTFSIGNAVSAGFQLYRTNAKQYLKIALVAVLWSLLPVLIVIAIGMVAAIVYSATQEPTSLVGLIVLAAIAVLVLWFYCVAKSLTNSALISRLAFNQLSSQPEELKDARRFVNARKWSFLLSKVFVAFIVLGLMLAFSVVIGILVGILVTAGGGWGSSGNALLAFILGLLLFGLIIAAIGFFTWLGARLAAVEVPLAVEIESSATKTISRIWNLTKNNAWQVFFVFFITFCVTIPVYLLAQVLSVVPRVLITILIPADSDTYFPLQVLFGLVSYATGLVLGILVLPLWQSIKAVIYHDLRNRQEGFGLQLRDRGEPQV
ncbi:MAG: hypothetical protein WCA35_11785 [Kovacikia sp.]